MMIRIRRYLSRYLLILIGLTAFLQLRLVWVVGEIWSPMDELAHYDYIDRLSSGQLPRADDSISSYSAAITAEYFGFPEIASDDPVAVRSAGRSYEANQFPLYYALMAAPNWLLKQLAVPPPVEVRILRSFDVVFHIGAALIVVRIFAELSTMLGLEPLFGYFVACLMASVRLLYRFQISPDQLTPLLGVIFVYLLVRLWRTGKSSYLGWSALVVSLAFLTKPASGILYLVWILSAVIFYRRSDAGNWRLRLWHVAPLCLAPAYFLVNGGLPGFPDLPSRLAAQAMGGLIEPKLIILDVLALLTRQSLDWAPVWTPRAGIALLAIGVIVGNYVLSFYRCFVLGERSMAPVFVACQVSGLVLLAALLLNPYVEGAVWYHFRHWEAYSVFWYTALLATPLLVRWRWLNAVAVALGTVFATVMTGLWLFL